MTQGVAFLLSMLIEGTVAAVLGAVLRKRLHLPSLAAAARTGAAAIIATGATYPVLWLEFPRLLTWTGIWWGAAGLSLAGGILVECLFYAAALRGHWGWSLMLSSVANALAFGGGLLLAPWLTNQNG